MSNTPNTDALWKPVKNAIPDHSGHCDYTFADNYRDDEYKFACEQEMKIKALTKLIVIMSRMIK